MVAQRAAPTDIAGLRAPASAIETGKVARDEAKIVQLTKTATPWRTADPEPDAAASCGSPATISRACAQ
jgi:hypothetical protein